MKKKLTLVLTLALVFALAPMSAFADTLTSDSPFASHSVKATYAAGTPGGTGTVYSVDITWGGMDFTYTAGDGTWDPTKHAYTNGGEGRWSSENNTVKVTNHSNAEVNVTLAYAAADGYTNINGEFDKSTISLATAVDTEVDAAPTDTAKLTLRGALDSSVTASTQIGTITVTLG